jgi:hypothetical protein
LIAQLKHYNGGFKTSNFNGMASYSYLEASSGRLFNGPFRFESEDGKVLITGGFQNDFKNGLWSFKFSGVKSTDFTLDYMIDSKVTGYFNNGNLEGEWKLERLKNIRFAQNGFSRMSQSYLNDISYMFTGETVNPNKEKTILETSKAYFNNNKFAGKFNYTLDNNQFVSGQFDSSGYMDGDWIIASFKNGVLINEIRSYRSGVLMTEVIVDYSTGDKRKVYDKADEVLEFFKNWDNKTEFSVINSKCYRFKNYDVSLRYTGILYDALGIWMKSSSIEKSAYSMELKRGSIGLPNFPERRIEYDYNLTASYNEKKEREVLLRLEEENERIAKENERIAREKETKEVNSLLEKRRRQSCNLEDSNNTAYNNLYINIETTVFKNLSTTKVAEFSLSGDMIFLCDTLGRNYLDFKNITTSNNEILLQLKTQLESLRISAWKIKGVAFNTFATVPINLKYYTGTNEIIVKEVNGVKMAKVRHGGPKEFIAEEIKKVYGPKDIGIYQVEYCSMETSESYYNDIKTIRYKDVKKKREKIFSYIILSISVVYLVATRIL